MIKLNYSCVPSQKCDTGDDLSGPRDGVGTFLKTENLFDQLGLADYAECPDLENEVCCHDEYVIPDNGWFHLHSRQFKFHLNNILN